MSRKNLCLLLMSAVTSSLLLGLSIFAAEHTPKMMDVIRLTNGNKIIGKVTHISEGMAEIQIEGVGETIIPLREIASISKQAYMPPAPPPALSSEEQRALEERRTQERQRAQEEYERYLERRFRQQVFEEERRRQLQLEADWRVFMSRANINRRFQEDMLFRRFGCWGRFAPWAW